MSMYDSGVDFLKAVAEHIEEVSSIAAASQWKMPTVKDEIDAILASLKSAETTGMPTGFARLDDMCSGWQRGNLYIIAGPAGIGKTSLATRFMLNLASAGRVVLFLSLEMSIRQVVSRMLSMLARVPFRKFRQPSTITEADWPMILGAMGKLSEYRLLVDDTPNLALADVLA